MDLASLDFDFSPLWENWRFLVHGLGITVLLSIAGAATSILLGLGIALLRLYGPRWLSVLMIFYVDSMRAIPFLVVLVWMYFALPIAADAWFDGHSGMHLPPFWAALLALTLHVAAYASEVVRAGIESVRAGQWHAARALGMSQSQLLRSVILPQAVIRMLPAFGSILTVAIKDTAVAAVIAVPELLHRVEVVAGQSYRYIELYSTALLAYFLILFPVTRAVDRYYQRSAHRGRS